MKSFIVSALSALAVCALGPAALAASGAPADSSLNLPTTPASDSSERPFEVERRESDGSVTIGGRRIDYQAVAGTLLVHPKGWDDVQIDPDKTDKKPDALASMFYVAYLAKGVTGPRPITFLYNGGPGSATVWLHMGAFGPRRIVTADDTHTGAAPYRVVNNDLSLLDASDLVFIDAPGTGFSRVTGKDVGKAFFNIDGDAEAFADFITQFLSRFQRWNSPKFLFGESYGTTRDAIVVNILEQQRDLNFNGIINLSQILLWEASPDDADRNPGVDLPYELALPTYAATAWYHHALPNAPKELSALITEVEEFATHDYARALHAGRLLDDAEKQRIAQKLHDYTGLPLEYVLRTNLRITGGEFTQSLALATDTTIGRLDTRFSGPTMDALAKSAAYDPQEAAIASAYVSAFNQYVRTDLKYGVDRTYKSGVDSINDNWDFRHKPVGVKHEPWITPNILPDLAAAMLYNPGLKVMLNAGYFDLATPFYEGIFEFDHLPIPQSLRSNLEVKLYPSGHMVYANAAAHKQLHDNVADFIRRASSSNPAEH